MNTKELVEKIRAEDAISVGWVWRITDHQAEKLIQDYSDQQNKDKDAEIQRLTRELKQAEDILEPQIKGAIAWQEEAEKLELEVERLTKEVGELKKQRKAEIYEAQQKIHAEYKDREERVYQRNAKVEIENTSLRELLGLRRINS